MTLTQAAQLAVVLNASVTLVVALTALVRTLAQFGRTMRRDRKPCPVRTCKGPGPQ